MKSPRHSTALVLALLLVFAGGMQQAAARTYKVLYTFKGKTDGINPVGPLVMDAKGNLFGVTTYGGPNYGGTLFELSPPAVGQTTWTETIIGSLDVPLAGLIIDKNGALYGTNSADASEGDQVFKFTPPPSGSGQWTETIIDTYFQYVHNGRSPEKPLFMDAQGRIYGTTAEGGLHNGGTVFMLDPSKPLTDGEWKETLLYQLAHGGSPQSNVTADATGHVYGLDGNNLFKLTPPAAGKIYYTYRALAPACNGDGVGLTPYGNGFYVMCNSGVYFMAPPSSGTTWTTTTIHTFGAPGLGGTNPTSAVTVGVNGELYYSTQLGGAYGRGAVEVLKKPSSGTGPWAVTQIHAMTGGTGGSAPMGAVFLDTKGNLYGATSNGGNTDTTTPPKGGRHPGGAGDGVIYELAE